MAIESTSSTSLTISWTPIGITVTGYSISYSNRDTQCFTGSATVSGVAAGETSHTLTGLEEGTEYTITVTALLAGGGSDEDSVTATTLAAGEVAQVTHCPALLILSPSSCPPSSSVCPSHFCQYI